GRVELAQEPNVLVVDVDVDEPVKTAAWRDDPFPQAWIAGLEEVEHVSKGSSPVRLHHGLSSDVLAKERGDPDLYRHRASSPQASTEVRMPCSASGGVSPAPTPQNAS